jgi:sarcosine oxidase subunit gamma
MMRKEAASMLEIAPLAVAGVDLSVGSAPVSGTVYGQAVTLSPAAPMARWSLRAKDAGLLSAAIGRELPQRIGTHRDGIARLGPDEWHALLPQGSTLQNVSGQPISQVDVSARAIGFTLTGPGAAAALGRGCPLDLARLTPGRATRTVFETVEIQIWAMAPDVFHVEVWRSFAPWLWHALAEPIA